MSRATIAMILDMVWTGARRVIRVVWLICYVGYFTWVIWEPIAYLQWRLKPEWGYHSGFGFFSGRGRITGVVRRLLGADWRGMARDVVAHVGGRPTLKGGIAISLFNAFGRNQLFTGSGLSLWLRASLTKRFDKWLEQEKPTQDVVPARIFNTIDHTLRSLSQDQCYANVNEVSEDEFYYYVGVTYNDRYNPAAVDHMLSAIDDQLARIGHAGATILVRPIRIRIPRHNQPIIMLADLWPDVLLAPINERLALLGSSGRPAYLTLAGEQSGGLIAGRPGAGKSQMALSIILSMRLTNSPDTLRIIIVDTKMADFPLLAALPGVQIVTSANMAANTILGLVVDMEKRRGQPSSSHQAILLYVDEVADLLGELDKERSKEVVEALLRLSQLGRALDILPWLATQRVYAIPADAYASLGVRVVGRVRNGTDSTAATGVKGSECHFLPGRGAFEVYGAIEFDDATRVQGAFVADSKSDDYARQLKPFIDSINARWSPGPPEPTKPTEKTDEAIPTEIDGFPAEMVYEAIRLYIQNALTQSQARKLSRELRGVDMDSTMSTRFLQLIREVAATEIAEKLQQEFGAV